MGNSKWIGLDNRNSSNSPLGYIREGLLSEGYLRLRFSFFWGGGGGWVIFGRAYYRNFTVYELGK